MIERLADPLVHLIRNAVDHGLESADRRAAAGKSAKGTVRLSAVYSGAEVAISVSDYGAGLDTARKPGSEALADTDLGEAVRAATGAALAGKPGIVWLVTNNRNSPNNDGATAARNREFYAAIHGGAVVGVHLTDVPIQHAQTPPADLSAKEKAYLAQVERFSQLGGGYKHIQGTRPWTPAAALNDSPAGLAAWIVEKFYHWSDCGDDIESRYSKDELITHVMLYWVTQTIGTSFLAYRDFTKPGAVRGAVEKVKEWLAPKGAPAGFALFPKDIARPPREWAERFYDVRRWSEMERGGHFAALEEPERLAEEIRAFFRPLRAVPS